MKATILLKANIRLCCLHLSIRQWLLVCLLIINAHLLFSQGVKIGPGVPDASAILDISSTNKGLLIPRMTTAQRLDIPLPPVSLLVFDQTTSTIWYHHLFNWTQLKSMWVLNGDAIYNSNTGNVGIGLTDANAPLDVNGTIRALKPGGSPAGSYISFSASLNDPAIFLARGNGSGGVVRTWDMKIDDDLSFKLTDNTSNQLRMVIHTSGSIGIGTTNPHASAALEIESTTKGFFAPRMTKLQREAIDSPAHGLWIWCSDCGPDGQMQMFDGNYWTDLMGKPPAGFEPGDEWGGGRLAYIFQPGDPGYISGEVHGLIAAENDLTSSEWGCQGTNLPGCESSGMGYGNQNTVEILAGCGSANIAARRCSNLVLNNYSDWFLPSLAELDEVFDNQDAIGGFMGGNYWSSTESGPNQARAIDFSSAFGDFYTINKSTVLRVRPARYF